MIPGRPKYTPGAEWTEEIRKARAGPLTLEQAKHTGIPSGAVPRSAKDCSCTGPACSLPRIRPEHKSSVCTPNLLGVPWGALLCYPPPIACLPKICRDAPDALPFTLAQTVDLFARLGLDARRMAGASRASGKQGARFSLLKARTLTCACSVTALVDSALKSLRLPPLRLFLPSFLPALLPFSVPLCPRGSPPRLSLVQNFWTAAD